MKKPTTPKALDAIADVVLRYKPKPVSAAAKKRKRTKRKHFFSASDCQNMIPCSHDLGQNAIRL